MTSPGGNERAGVAASLAGDVTESGVFRAVLDGYDAVYDALPRGETFSRLWRMHAYDGDFPEQFAHIGFLTVPEAQRMRELLQIRPGDVLADLACGAGGPGFVDGGAIRRVADWRRSLALRACGGTSTRA